MNREILFRGKRKDNGEWVEGFYMKHINRQISPIGDTLKPEDIEHLILTSGFADWNMPRQISGFEVDPDTVGQYVGIEDKNGAKIFEGDITKVAWHGWKCEVMWSNEDARFICFTLESERRVVYVGMVDKNDKSAHEVIGNIHDIPEQEDPQ